MYDDIPEGFSPVATEPEDTSEPVSLSLAPAPSPPVEEEKKPKEQPQPALLEPGNIDLHDRPVVKNPDGSISTVRSISIDEDGKSVLIPTVIYGDVVSNEDAIRHYHATGSHLGKFANEASATAYAKQLHEQQAAEYLPKQQQQQQPASAPTSSPITVYSKGTKAGGPDPNNDPDTNAGKSSTGPNLTEGIVAVDPRVYPIGSILRDEKSGRLFLAGDKHGAADPKTVDVYTDPANYNKATEKSGETRQFSIVGKVDPKDIPKTPEEVTNLLNQVGQSQPPKQGGQESGGINIIDAVDPTMPAMSRPRNSPITKIVVHGDVSTNVPNLIAYQKKVDRGYHYYIGTDGSVKMVVPPDHIANHIKGANSDSIGIVIAGADNGQMPTPAQEASANKLIAMLGSKYGIDPQNVRGHGERQPGRRDIREGGNIAANIRKNGYGTGTGDALLPSGQEAAPSRAGPIGHDTAPDGSRPMGEGRYIWPGEPGDPSQPAGEGKYIWPGAQRASPEEIAAAHAEAAAPPWATPLAADLYGLKSWRDLTGTSRTGFLGQRAPSPSLYDQMTKPDPSLGGFHAAAAVPIYGYNPNPTPITGVPYAPSQPEQVVQQPQPAPAPSQMITTPEGVQVPDQWGFATFTQPGALPAETPTLAPGPTKEAAAAQVAVEAPKTPAGTQSDILDAANTFVQGGTADGILLAISSLDKLALNNLPGWKILDPIRKNLESEHKQSEFLREKIRQGTPVDRDFQEKFVGEALHMAGMLAGTLPFYAVPGAGGLITVGQMYDMGYQDYVAERKEKGLSVDEAAANRAGLKFLGPAGAAQYALNKSIVGKFLLAHSGQTKKEILVGLGKLAGHGGATFGGMRVWQNVVAKHLEGYDPDRPITEGVMHDVGLGAITAAAGGAAGAGTRAFRERVTTKKLEEGATQLEGVEVAPVGELTPEERAGFERKAPPETKPPTEAAPAAAPEAPGTTAAVPTMITKKMEADLKAAGFSEKDINAMTPKQAWENLQPKPPTAGEEVKPSMAMPEAPAAPETVKVRAFDPKAREFVEAEMRPTKELHEQLKREENAYTTLIKCLEL